MKLATLNDGTKDGQLIIVSKDLNTFVKGRGLDDDGSILLKLGKGPVFFLFSGCAKFQVCSIPLSLKKTSFFISPLS